MQGKKSFILYCDWITEVQQLSDKDAGNLFKAILDYVNGNFGQLPLDLIDLYCRITEQIAFEWDKQNPKTGKYHWNYKGGITDENHAIRTSIEYKHWRSSVFVRDDFTCQDCQAESGKLNAHHIKEFSDYPQLRLDIDNGVTLCELCHKKRHKK